MFYALSRYFNRKRLKDPAYACLFEPAPQDEAVCFDCETSSLDPRKAQLLSIGAVRIQGNRVLTSRKLELFVRPTGDIDADSIKIHRLRHCDVAGGLEAGEAVRRFLDFIGPRTLVGYYLEFDVAMIDKYLQPLLGIRLPNPQIDVSGLYYQRKLKNLPAGLPHPHIDLRFETILHDLALPRLGQHDALNDALMTALIYLGLRNSR
jgi:DNA polymerase-3 subunit epsilon